MVWRRISINYLHMKMVYSCFKFITRKVTREFIPRMYFICDDIFGGIVKRKSIV